jgi:quercetin dioxygenase-like cupin family protein
VAKRATSYELWLEEEGIPVVDGYGIEDVTLLPRKPWKRTGGSGAYIDLKGMEGFTGMYVCEIPAGGALEPENHLYEELIYIIKGMGATEIWSAEDDKRKMHFEWHPGSLFAIPLNTRHCMINGSNEPAIFLAVTSAPLMIDLLHNVPFVMGCDYKFNDRFDGQADYFVPTSDRKEVGGFINWDSNFIADARGALVDPSEAKGFGVRITSFDMGGSTLVGHIAEWPVGRYHKAHFHQGGAILLILRSRGYTLMWPPEAGIRPYHAATRSKSCASTGAKVAFSVHPAVGITSISIPATNQRGNWHSAIAGSRESFCSAAGARLTRKEFVPAYARAAR